MSRSSRLNTFWLTGTGQSETDRDDFEVVGIYRGDFIDSEWPEVDELGAVRVLSKSLQRFERVSDDEPKSVRRLADRAESRILAVRQRRKVR